MLDFLKFKRLFLMVLFFCNVTAQAIEQTQLYFELAPCAECNYCHLVRDTLFPLFVALARMGRQRSFSENILYCNKSTFKSEVFKVVTDHAIRVVRYNPLTMNKLVFEDVYSNKQLCVAYFSQFLKQLHERFHIHHDSCDQKMLTIVYRFSRRAMLNFRDVQRHLAAYCQSKNYRFYVAHMEELSFAQQLQLMNETDIFIACHGAAMTNAAFMRPRGIVIEIFPYNFKYDFFQRHIEYCRPDIRYHRWTLSKNMCFPVGHIDKNFEYRYWRDQDVKIDFEYLTQLVDRFAKIS